MWKRALLRKTAITETIVLIKRKTNGSQMSRRDIVEISLILFFDSPFFLFSET